MDKCDRKECKVYSEVEDNNCLNVFKVEDCEERLRLMEKEAHLSVSSSAGLEGPDQAIEALGKLADYWDSVGAYGEAYSNREYIKVIKGQVICRKLVEKEKAA